MEWACCTLMYNEKRAPEFEKEHGEHMVELEKRKGNREMVWLSSENKRNYLKTSHFTKFFVSFMFEKPKPIFLHGTYVEPEDNLEKLVLSPSTIWILRITLRSTSVAANTFTLWAVSPTQKNQLLYVHGVCCNE